MRWFVVESHLRTMKTPFNHLNDMGWGNGYVIMSKEHPWHGVSYDNLNDIVYAHGGLTYSETLTKEHTQSWLDLSPADIGKHMIGFDTSHFMDTFEKWPKSEVILETQALYRQVQSMGGKYKFLT